MKDKTKDQLNEEIINLRKKIYDLEIFKLTREVEDVYLNIRYAIPCGLIIQELVSNSLNHAFPEGREGEILIRMHQKKNGITQLIIKDNGIGLPSGMDLFNTKAVGLRLVKDFVGQIDGTIHSNPSHGIQYTVLF